VIKPLVIKPLVIKPLVIAPLVIKLVTVKPVMIFLPGRAGFHALQARVGNANMYTVGFGRGKYACPG
jgi:hypothetical protein